MAIRQETLTDGSIVVELDTTEDWNAFAADNLDAIIERYGSQYNAHVHLVDGGVELGGGASPSVVVCYVV